MSERQMDTAIDRAEHKEFERRMEVELKRLADEDARQNKRLDKLEDNLNQVIIQQLTSLTTTIEKLNLSVSNLLKEQAELSKRVEKLESRDGDMWRSAVKYGLSAIIGGLITFALVQLGVN